MENTILKEKLKTVDIEVLQKEEKISLPEEYSRLREKYCQLLGSQKAFEIFLGSQRSILRKEGLGYEPDATNRLNEGTKWVKEGTEEIFKFLEPQVVSTTVEIEEKEKGSRTYLIDESIRRDPKYRYSHSYGMLGSYRIVDKLIDPLVSTVKEPPRVEFNRVTYSRFVPTSSRLRPVGRIDNLVHHREVPRASISPSRVPKTGPYRMDPSAPMHYHRMAEHLPLPHPHIPPPHHMPVAPFEIFRTIPRFGVPQFPSWVPMGWN